MARSFALVCAVLVAGVLLIAAPRAESAITCGAVASGIAPCIGYLKGNPAVVPPPCCSGVIKLNVAARTTADRQAACSCLKSLAGKIPGINYGRAAGIPGACHVNVGFPISLSVDCSKVH